MQQIGFLLQNLFLFNMFRAPLCPSSGALELYKWLLPVVLGSLVYRSLVWCGAVGYVKANWMQQIGFLLQNLLFAQHVSGTIMPIIRSSRVIQMAAACGTWLFGLQVIGLVWNCGLCKGQLDATDWFFIAKRIVCSTRFGHLHAHHREL